jgi:hypothetical protein
MLKLIGTTVVVAVLGITAGQAFALNPQPLPPRQTPHITVPPHVPPHVTCPPPKGNIHYCM